MHSDCLPRPASRSCVRLVWCCSLQHCAAWCSGRSLCCAQAVARSCLATLSPGVPSLVVLALQAGLHSEPHVCLVVSGQSGLASQGTEGGLSPG